jgi:hypothetical protein
MRLERAKIKAGRRADLSSKRKDAPARPTDHDPDIVGITAGPQEMPDWQREFFEDEQKAKEAAELEAQESKG